MRACNQLGQFLSHRETNLRYLALETMCLLATSEFSHEAVKKHQETVISSLKVGIRSTRRLSFLLLRWWLFVVISCDKKHQETVISSLKVRGCLRLFLVIRSTSRLISSLKVGVLS